MHMKKRTVIIRHKFRIVTVTVNISDFLGPKIHAAGSSALADFSIPSPNSEVRFSFDLKECALIENSWIVLAGLFDYIVLVQFFYGLTF